MVRIPEEYQEVEYIESTGTQYILTNYIPTITEDMKIELDYVFTVTQTGESMIFGSTARSTGIRFQCEYYNSTYWYVGSGVNQFRQVLNGVGKTINTRYSLFMDGETFTVDNQSIGYTNKWSGSQALPMCIFAINWINEIKYLNRGIKIYKLIFTANEAKEADFIPCYRKSDDEIGMYDTVSKQFYTNSGTGTFLKGHNVYYDDVNLLEQRRKILLNTPHLETIQNNIATFNTDMNVSLKDCKIYFSPIQEGEGDPSPDNVRPIRGWDGINVYIGRNILNRMTLNYRNGSIIYPYNYGSVTVYGKTGSACTNWIDCSQYRGQTLTLNHAPEPGSAGWCFYSATNTSDYVTGFYSRDDSSVVEGGLWTITVPNGDNINYMRFSTHPDYLDDIQILLNMETTTIPFPQTIYGGYVDLIKGEIVEEWYSIVFDGENIKANSDYSNNKYIRAYWVYFSPVGYNIQKAFCNKLTISYNDSSSVFPFLRLERVGMLYGGLVLGTPEDYPELASGTKTDRINAINNWFKENPTQVVYKRKNNVTYSLSPQTLKALKGTNNIFSNANGNIQVKFWKH